MAIKNNIMANNVNEPVFKAQFLIGYVWCSNKLIEKFNNHDQWVCFRYFFFIQNCVMDKFILANLLKFFLCLCANSILNGIDFLLSNQIDLISKMCEKSWENPSLLMYKRIDVLFNKQSKLGAVFWIKFLNVSSWHVIIQFLCWFFRNNPVAKLKSTKLKKESTKRSEKAKNEWRMRKKIVFKNWNGFNRSCRHAHVSAWMHRLEVCVCVRKFYAKNLAYWLLFFMVQVFVSLRAEHSFQG